MCACVSVHIVCQYMCAFTTGNVVFIINRRVGYVLTCARKIRRNSRQVRHFSMGGVNIAAGISVVCFIDVCDRI